MVVYLTSFILTLLFSRIYVKNYANVRTNLNVGNFKLKKLCVFLLAVLPFWFISAFRYDVGTDYFYTYVKYFQHVIIGYKPYKEVLFELLNEVLVYLNMPYVWLFIITSLIIIVCFYIFVFKYSTHPLYSIALFFCSSFFFHSLNNVRQFVGMAIAVLGLFEKRPVKGFVLISIGAMFHTAILVFIPALLIRNVKLSKKTYIILSLLLCASMPLLIPQMLDIIALTKYSYFLNSEKGYSVLIILVNLYIFLLSLFYYNKEDKYRVCYYMQAVAFAACIASMVFQNEELWVRTIKLLSITQLLLVPTFIDKERSKGIKIFIGVSVLAAYSVYTLYTVYYCGGLEVFPYKFIFNAAICF